MKRLSLLVFSVFMFVSCSKNEDSDNSIETPQLSEAKEISEFKLTANDQVYSGIIRNDSVLFQLPSNSSLNAISPTITISSKAIVSPKSGQEVNFTNPVKYTVTAEDNSTKEYIAAISLMLSSDNGISSLTFPDETDYHQRSYFKNPTDIDTLAYDFPYGTDISALVANIIIDENASVVPASGEVLDYSSPVLYEIQAEDGSVSEIMVIASVRGLDQLEIDSFYYNQFDDAELGGDITFEVSEIHPVKESIQVRLFSDDESFDLVVKSINVETKEITATLPEIYRNNSFQLEVFIESDNSDISDGFRLLKGTNNFVAVNDFYEDGSTQITEKLVWPGQLFNSTVYIKNDDVENQDYYLLKGGIYYELKKNGTFNNNTTTGLKLEMPDLPESFPTDGNDFEFVIRSTDGEEVFDFTNSEGNPINIEIAQAPVVNSVNATTIPKNGTLTLSGSNLYYPISGNYNSNVIEHRAFLELRKTGSARQVTSVMLDANGDISFDLSKNSYLTTGTYQLIFTSNVKAYGEIDTGISVTLVQPPSEHATLDISEAKLYSSSNTYTPKQILLTFNENIESYTVKKIVTGRSETVEIENFFTYPTTALTGALSDEDFTKVIQGKDGYVIVEDSGVEYKIYFTLQYIP